jgi:hypothetical protein
MASEFASIEERRSELAGTQKVVCGGLGLVVGKRRKWAPKRTSRYFHRLLLGPGRGVPRTDRRHKPGPQLSIAQRQRPAGTLRCSTDDWNRLAVAPDEVDS